MRHSRKKGAKNKPCLLLPEKPAYLSVFATKISEGANNTTEIEFVRETWHSYILTYTKTELIVFHKNLTEYMQKQGIIK